MVHNSHKIKQSTNNRSIIQLTVHNIVMKTLALTNPNNQIQPIQFMLISMKFLTPHLVKIFTMLQ